MDAIRLTQELRLESSPAALWPLVSNTNRLNRSAGLPENAVEPIPGSFHKTVRARLGGWPVVWREAPFDYVESRSYSVVREFRNGPLARFEGGIRLTPDGSGTRVVLHGAFTPRHGIARGLVGLFAAKASRDMARMLTHADRSLLRPEDFPPLPNTLTPADETLLTARALSHSASGAEPAAAARLVAHLRAAPDDEVVRFRPYELADRWGMPRLAVLGACLHAVKAGLLDMRWEVLCPNCAGAPESLAKLSELKQTSHCPGCGIQYGVDFDQSVEIRFTVHPSIRGARGAIYCAGSPAHSPHAIAQQALAAGETREIELDLEARSYLARGLGGRRSVRLRPRADAPAELTVDLGRAEEGAELAFRPGRVRLRLTSAEPELARVEAENWRDAGATAAQVTELQEFRDLFSSEVLAPGLEISVKRLALLFTDLKGSTAMYERIGDATAYAVVRDHFDYLTAIIAARRGAVVKTIGDAVMAVFASGADALEAALDMQERIAELDAKLAPRPPVILKIGVHEGAAIAINSNGVIDYFGTTANVAARVQGESEGGDIVLTDSMGEDPAVLEVMARRAAEFKSFDITLKGLSSVQRLWRLRPRPRA